VGAVAPLQSGRAALHDRAHNKVRTSKRAARRASDLRVLGWSFSATGTRVLHCSLSASAAPKTVSLIRRPQPNTLPVTSPSPCVHSNHEDLRHIAETFGIRYEVFKISKATKPEQEQKEIELMKSLDIDLVVLARYMQIISDDFCNTFPHRVINIHHSFLPAFIGGKPYHRAYDRGVKVRRRRAKQPGRRVRRREARANDCVCAWALLTLAPSQLIGATAHYATADLDEGPIIEQDIKRISHRDAVDDLVRKGRAIEKEVLVRAVKKHLQKEIIVEKNRCVIFGD